MAGRGKREDNFTVEDIEDFTPRTRFSKPVRTPGDYTRNIGNAKPASSTPRKKTQFTGGEVSTPKTQSRVVGEGKGIQKGTTANKTYLRNPYHSTQSQQEKDYLASKRPQARPVLTPGDYTRNIGNAKPASKTTSDAKKPSASGTPKKKAKK